MFSWAVARRRSVSCFCAVSRPYWQTAQRRPQAEPPPPRKPSPDAAGPTCRPGSRDSADWPESACLRGSAANRRPIPGPWRSVRCGNSAIAFSTIVWKSTGMWRFQCRSGFEAEPAAIEEQLRVGRVAGRMVQRGEFVQRDAERVDVGAMIDEPAAARAPARGSCTRIVPRTSPVCVRPVFSRQRARPKSVTHSLPVGVDEQVRRLHVAVDDAVFVGRVQAPRPLARPMPAISHVVAWWPAGVSGDSG